MSTAQETGQKVQEQADDIVKRFRPSHPGANGTNPVGPRVCRRAAITQRRASSTRCAESFAQAAPSAARPEIHP